MINNTVTDDKNPFAINLQNIDIFPESIGQRRGKKTCKTRQKKNIDLQILKMDLQLFAINFQIFDIFSE